MNNVVDFKKPKKDKKPSPNHPPMINLPPMTKALLFAIFGVFLATSLLNEADMTSIYLNFGFIPALWSGESAHGFDIFALISPITYTFLHGSWMHVIMNGTMLMAFGAGVEKWMGAKRFISFYFLCGTLAVVVEFIISPFSVTPVIGASGAESGLFAAILILLQSQGRLPTGKYGIWPFAALWIGLSVVFGLFSGGNIAWASHLGGFIAGFGLLKLNYFKSDI